MWAGLVPAPQSFLQSYHRNFMEPRLHKEMIYCSYAIEGTPMSYYEAFLLFLALTFCGYASYTESEDTLVSMHPFAEKWCL